MMAQRPGLTRAWGDGGGDIRDHVIGDISFAEGWVICARCGVQLDQGDFMSLEAAWDAHRGARFHPGFVRAELLATDSEVEEFLKHVEDPAYESSVGADPTVTGANPDFTMAYELLERLVDEHCDPFPEPARCGVCANLVTRGLVR